MLDWVKPYPTSIGECREAIMCRGGVQTSAPSGCEAYTYKEPTYAGGQITTYFRIDRKKLDELFADVEDLKNPYSNTPIFMSAVFTTVEYGVIQDPGRYRSWKI